LQNSSPRRERSSDQKTLAASALTNLSTSLTSYLASKRDHSQNRDRSVTIPSDANVSLSSFFAHYKIPQDSQRLFEQLQIESDSFSDQPEHVLKDLLEKVHVPAGVAVRILRDLTKEEWWKHL